MNNLIAILGGGESGVGAAILAQKKGFSVFLSDSGKIKEKYKQVLADYNIEFEEEKHSTEKILSAFELQTDFDLDIMKPGQSLAEITRSVMEVLPEPMLPATTMKRLVTNCSWMRRYHGRLQERINDR